MKNKTFSFERNLTEMKQNGLGRAREQMGVVRPLTTLKTEKHENTSETRSWCFNKILGIQHTHSLIVDLKQ